MAGFVGLVRLDGAPLPETLRTALFQAACEGRDYLQDSYSSPAQDVALLRLHSGILSATPQPVRSPDGRIILFLAGEIFNEDLDLKAQPESVLKAYLREGDALFSRLNGSFALAIVESDLRRLRLVTDRTASIPVFYLRRDNLLAFSPTLKPLLGLLKSPVKISPIALANFLSSGSILEGKSLALDVVCLRPAQMLTVENSTIQIRAYWRFSYAQNRDQRDPRALQEELYCLMLKAVARQTRDNIPFAITLSGGYDSRSILACMRRIDPDRPIRTVTWGADEHLPGSDAVVARDTAQHFRTTHTFYQLDAAALPNHFRDFVRASEGRVDAAGNYPESLRIFERIRGELQVNLLYRGNEFFGVRNRVVRERQSWFWVFIPDLSTLRDSYAYFKPEIRRMLCELSYQQLHRLYQELPYDDPNDRKDHLFIAQRWPGYHSSLTQLKRRVIEERNPYLDNDLMDFVSHLPGRLRVWKNLYISTVQQMMPEFQQLGASKVISLVDWDARLRADKPLQDFVRQVLLESRNGFDNLLDRHRLALFLERYFRPNSSNRRSFYNRARRRLRHQFDRYELEPSLEIFRLMILKIWADDFLHGQFDLD